MTRKETSKNPKLSEPQKRALLFLHSQNGWTNKTPTTQKCLNCLKDKGLVIVAYSLDLGWCERITDEGRNIVSQLGSVTPNKTIDNPPDPMDREGKEETE